MKTNHIEYIENIKNYTPENQANITKSLIEYGLLNTDDQIINYVQKLNKVYCGKTLGYLYKNSSNEINRKNKGWIGQLIEEVIFGVSKNTRNESDLSEIDVEIKTTGIIVDNLKGNKVFKAKERISLSQINYMKLINEPNFLSSSLFAKNNKTIFCFYKYERSSIDNAKLDELDFEILGFSYLKIEDFLDILTIINDYKTIYNKVFKGEAHLISSSDTNLLEACTKSSSSNIYVAQPNSLEFAKPRSFAYKNKFVTSLFNQSYKEIDLKIDENKLDETVQMVVDKLKNYEGFSVNFLQKEWNTVEVSKSKRFEIILKMLKISSTKELGKDFNDFVRIKTISFKHGTNKLKEHVKLVNIPLEEMEEDVEFEDTGFYSELKKIIIFVAFEKNESRNDEILSDVAVFKITPNLLHKAESVYYHTKELYNNGKIFKSGNLESNTGLNFIKGSQHIGFHIRPSGSSKLDSYLTPGGEMITKQAFWINKEVVEETFKNKK